MDYQRIYDQIIEKAKSENRYKDEGVYYEQHHIIPKCLGGLDKSENLVLLTAREHYICHMLLSELYPKYSVEWYKLNHAFMMMHCLNHKHSRYFSSRLYEYKRHDFSCTMSYSQTGERNSQYGTIWVTDGKTNMKISSNEKIPVGYSIGRTLSTKPKTNITCCYDITLPSKKVVKVYQQNKMQQIFGIEKTIDGLNEAGQILHKLYHVDRKSTNEIARMYNTNNETIRNYLKVFDIKIRTLSESQRINTHR